MIPRDRGVHVSDLFDLLSNVLNGANKF